MRATIRISLDRVISDLEGELSAILERLAERVRAEGVPPVSISHRRTNGGRKIVLRDSTGRIVGSLVIEFE